MRLGAAVVERVYVAAGVPVLWHRCPTCLRAYDQGARLTLSALRAAERDVSYGASPGDWSDAVRDAWGRMP